MTIKHQKKKKSHIHTEGGEENIRNKVKGENESVNLCNWLTHPLSLFALPGTLIWSSWPRLRGVGVGGVRAWARERVNDTCLD